MLPCTEGESREVLLVEEGRERATISRNKKRNSIEEDSTAVPPPLFR